MAFQSKDGKSFGSKFVAKRRDTEHDKASQVMGATSPEPAMGAEKPAANEPEQKPQENPEQVVATHGPATQVTVHHDHKSNKHHIVSRHPDGHIHTSDHNSAQEAHDAAAKLSGGDQPVGTEQPEAAAAPSPDGFAMPKLA